MFPRRKERVDISPKITPELLVGVVEIPLCFLLVECWKIGCRSGDGSGPLQLFTGKQNGRTQQCFVWVVVLWKVEWYQAPQCSIGHGVVFFRSFVGDN